jgi:hypothetical protein
MSHEDPVEERRLQYLARAEEARIKAQQAEDHAIREWWLSAARLGGIWRSDPACPQAPSSAACTAICS